MTVAVAQQQDLPQGDLESLAGVLDAILWLEWQGKQGKVDQWVKKPSRYRLDRDLSAHRFAITYDRSGHWVLAALDEPAMAWFVSVPWECIYLHAGENPTMTLVCPRLEIPTTGELLGEPAVLPMFGVDIPGSRKILPIMADDECIKVGLFSYGAQNQFALGTSFREVPIMQKS